jgi:hypothetical protein
MNVKVLARLNDGELNIVICCFEDNLCVFDHDSFLLTGRAENGKSEQPYPHEENKCWEAQQEPGVVYCT